MKYKYWLIIVLSLFFVNVFEAKESVTLYKCVDGDTARFIYNGSEERFRFLGIGWY